MDRSYESAHALVRPAVGPVGPHLGTFVASLIAKRYSVNCVYIKARHALAIDRWLETRGLALADFDESWIVKYQRSRSRRRSRRIETRRIERSALCQLLHFLRDEAVCSQAVVDTSPIDKVVADFGRYLQHEKGLAGTTIYGFTRIARQFLTGRFGDEEVRLDAIRPADVIEFVQLQSKRLRPPALKSATTALRSFFRYTQYCGETDAGLVASVPAVATWSTTPQLPKAISAEHALRAIESCDLSTVVGRRDRAVLLLLARLGLRACEILRLMLDDIDWANGSIRVRGKGGHQCLMPLPADAGEAIASYLQHGRTASDDRHLFLRSQAPIRGLMQDSGAIGSIVCYALRRAKVDAPHRGSHQFRHALAVRMLKHGASLPEIAEVLRHRSPQSSTIYARVDVEALRALALAWPGGMR
jgi:site-specific recombinase XerD